MQKIDVVNKALGKIGGAGDQVNGEAFLANLNGADKVTKWVLAIYDQIRQKVITDLALEKCPFIETRKYADLGNMIAAADLPIIGGWSYGFDLPQGCLIVVRQLEEKFPQVLAGTLSPVSVGTRNEYQFDTMLNKDSDGRILVTNDLCNADNDSAFIEYCIDQTAEAMWCVPFIECMATLLAAELCPLIGKDLKTRAALMQEYIQLCIPFAKSYNQSQYNNYAAKVPDYKGGRA